MLFRSITKSLPSRGESKASYLGAEQNTILTTTTKKRQGVRSGSREGKQKQDAEEGVVIAKASQEFEAHTWMDHMSLV